MRRLFLCPLLFGLVIPAFAQDKEPPDEPAVPEKLDKVMLTLDAGGHTANVTKVFFTPDGKQVVTVSADHSIRIWDALSGEAVKVLYPPGFGGLGAAALSPDGKTLAVGSRYPDGDQTLHVIYLVSLADGRIERVLKGHPQAIEAIAFSADGKRLASTSASADEKKDGTIRIWNPATGEQEQEFPFLGKPSSIFRLLKRGLAFSPDGGRLARVRSLGGPGDILDLATRKSVGKISAQAVAWSPDGKTLATAGALKGRLGIVLWNPDATERLRLLDEETSASSLAFSADSRTVLATWGDGEAAIFDVATGKQLVKPTKVKGAKHGALSPDGQLAATTTNHIGGIHGMTVWKTTDGAVVQQVWPAPWIFAGRDRDGWSADGKAVTWSRPNKRSFNLEKLQFGPRLSDEDFRGKVSKQGELSLEKIKDSKKWETLGTLARKNPTLVAKDRVAAEYRGVIYLFDAATGKVIRRFQGHHDEIQNLAPSPDGRFLLSTSVDQTLKIWNLERDKPLLTLFVKGNDWIVWTEEGYYDATPGGERLMGWKIDNGIDKAASFYPAEQFRKVLYRPDIIKLLLEKGSVEEAVKAANKVRKDKQQEIPRGQANPEKLLPPGVTLAIVDQSQLPKVTLKASARQSCPEQPIKSLRLLVDGRPLPNRQATVTFPEGKEKAQHEETWTVELPPGKHKLSVLARSKDDTPNASNVIGVASPLPENERPVVHHIAVGISKYDDKKLKLNYADADAQQLADAVAKNCAGQGNLYRAVRSKRLLNDDASRKAVLDAIEVVRKNAKANDLFLLSFAGHGVREEGEYFLLTKEADTTNAKTLEKSAISGAALREKLADFPCQVLLLLDACHSGAFGAGALAGYKPASDEAARALTDVDVRVAVMCAALGHEEALEKDGNGLFTSAVLKALKREGGSFYDRETGELNVYHLQAFVYQEVAKASDNKQTPFLKMPLASPPFVVTQFAR